MLELYIALAYMAVGAFVSGIVREVDKREGKDPSTAEAGFEMILMMFLWPIAVLAALGTMFARAILDRDDGPI